jgi:hypothetical protein
MDSSGTFGNRRVVDTTHDAPKHVAAGSPKILYQVCIGRINVRIYGRGTADPSKIENCNSFDDRRSTTLSPHNFSFRQLTNKQTLHSIQHTFAMSEAEVDTGAPVSALC